ncbi:LAMI_0H19768g1_1 [Lachancea mirantina]|uniref:Phosphatidylglycerol/phosphatidylinositol transfer protein n=1 Tax=Lachancea mirantina TaxID=1230905 RepID=A0A1G4KK27_9SACH|nr:LAMI_0H19768g1_1 [Lachancea mirantina]
MAQTLCIYRNIANRIKLNLNQLFKMAILNPRSLVFLAFWLAAATALPAFQGLFRFPGISSDNKPIAGDSPLQQCDASESQLLDIRLINLLPNPPVRGENLTISAAGKLSKEVNEGAYVDVEVRLGYIKLLSQTYDICEELENNDVNGLSCPLSPGEYMLEKSVEIPGEVPPGKYSIVARAFTVDDEEISCLTGEVLFPAY